MRNLIFVRHSTSKLDPGQAPNLWGLTLEGREQCVPLADRLADCKPDVIVTSQELKAVETGRIVAELLRIPWFSSENLHEYRRDAGPILRQDAFHAKISNLFRHPYQLVFGLETAQEALVRYTAAVQSVMAGTSAETVAIVSHGTVMSLFYGEITGKDAFSFWRRLGIPAFYTVSWPQLVVLSEVMRCDL